MQSNREPCRCGAEGQSTLCRLRPGGAVNHSCILFHSTFEDHPPRRAIDRPSVQHLLYKYAHAFLAELAAPCNRPLFAAGLCGRHCTTALLLRVRLSFKQYHMPKLCHRSIVLAYRRRPLFRMVRSRQGPVPAGRKKRQSEQLDFGNGQ